MKPVYESLHLTVCGVAPRRGARIETGKLQGYRLPGSESHPAGVRGLKQPARRSCCRPSESHRGQRTSANGQLRTHGNLRDPDMSMLKMPSGSRLKLRSFFVYEKTTNENIVHKAWCCRVKVQAERGIRSVGKSERFDSNGYDCCRWSQHPEFFFDNSIPIRFNRGTGEGTNEYRLTRFS